jgi:hypothetical protein
MLSMGKSTNFRLGHGSVAIESTYRPRAGLAGADVLQQLHHLGVRYFGPPGHKKRYLKSWDFMYGIFTYYIFMGF